MHLLGTCAGASLLPGGSPLVGTGLFAPQLNLRNHLFIGSCFGLGDIEANSQLP